MKDDAKIEFSKKAGPTLTVDWQLYANFFDESDLTDAEKREVIETLWSIVVSFIDMGFEVRSPDAGCGQDADENPEVAADVVPSIVDHWDDATNKSGAKPRGPKPPRRNM
ncbi:hypothetical protein HKCCE4037_16630 [Rhodobacterales bacterium HKCCE4037]|nr:hypothetical protein [Rhodobacterales bacterium HKCCE4037]